MKQLIALHVVHTFHVFNRYEFKNADRDQAVPSTWYIFNTDFHICELLLLLAYIRNRGIFYRVSGGFISHLYGNHVNVNMWKPDYTKARKFY